MLFKHIHTHVGSMHTFFTIILDKAVIHDEWHFFLYGSYINRLVLLFYLICNSFKIVVLFYYFRQFNTIAFLTYSVIYRLWNFAKVYIKILWTDVAKVAFHCLMNILFGD